MDHKTRSRNMFEYLFPGKLRATRFGKWENITVEVSLRHNCILYYYVCSKVQLIYGKMRSKSNSHIFIAFFIRIYR